MTVELVETRNTGEQIVYQTEKLLKDTEDKVSGKVRTDVETAVNELKATLHTTDPDDIRIAIEKVAAARQKLGQTMYADAQAAQGAAGAASAAGTEPAGAEDDVVDAEIVDDEKPADSRIRTS